MNAPKPCPFCGGELEESQYGYFINHKNGCFFGTRRYSLWSIRNFNGRGKKSTYDNVPERTCRIEYHYGEWYCHACGQMVGTCDTASILHIDGNAIELWGYCPMCGAKVVE